MKKNSIAMMLYGEIGSSRNAFTEEKFKNLAIAFLEKGFDVHSIIYNDAFADKLAQELLQFDAILVWVNPIEQGNNRKKLDALLLAIGQSCYVSAHPDVILKIGTKDVLYKTKEMDWGGDTKLYKTFEDFKDRFIQTLENQEIRILKQYRGNGGNEVFKISLSDSNKQKISVTHAAKGYGEKKLSITEFYDVFKSYFLNEGILIDQMWNPNIINGMVRCYITGVKVSGFGYQDKCTFSE